MEGHLQDGLDLDASAASNGRCARRTLADYILPVVA